MIEWLALLEACAPSVDPLTMTMLVDHESRGNPWAIGVNGGFRLVRQPRNKAEAVATATALAAAGFRFDVGYGQLSSANIAKFRLSYSEAFDPCTNLKYSSYLLADNFNRAMKRRDVSDTNSALHMALSAYNTGSFTAGLSNGYVRKVLGATYSLPIAKSSPQKKPSEKSLPKQ